LGGNYPLGQGFPEIECGLATRLKQNSGAGLGQPVAVSASYAAVAGKTVALNTNLGIFGLLLSSYQTAFRIVR
jgi:hypothetical protein